MKNTMTLKHKIHTIEIDLDNLEWTCDEMNSADLLNIDAELYFEIEEKIAPILEQE